MEKLFTNINALLFVAGKPLTFSKLAHLCHVSVADIQEALKKMQDAWAADGRGMTILTSERDAHLVTSPQNAEVVAAFTQDEMTGELTRPSLETLTIIAYRGPVAKSEIELIRGINCSLILRNLTMRGLIDEVGQTETGSPQYAVTTDFLRMMGVQRTADLPNYTELNKNTFMQELLAARQGDFFRTGS